MIAGHVLQEHRHLVMPGSHDRVQSHVVPGGESLHVEDVGIGRRIRHQTQFGSHEVSMGVNQRWFPSLGFLAAAVVWLRHRPSHWLQHDPPAPTFPEAPPGQ